MAKTISFEHVDVFTSRPFRGNQLAVFRNAGSLTGKKMQLLAREMNFSESVFLFPSSHRDVDKKLRIFTPAEEIPFAGHPVLGASYVILRHKKGRKPSSINLELSSGLIRTDIKKTDSTYRISMYQPIPEFGSALQNRGQVAKAFGLGRMELTGGGVVSNGLSFLIVEAENEESVKNAKLNTEKALNIAERYNVCGIYLFSRVEKKKVDIHARFFAPALSVTEDAATGSASGAMGGYMARILKFPRQLKLQIEQGVEMKRRSSIRVDVGCDRGLLESVKVTGTVSHVGEGSIRVP
ncbi:MAG: PhzF family phenazine biosynthesis isomerase [Candidatus Latescibacteria bacterium]|nr:PhzF family phenazine biosynthesis isomerase [bacterium]MBD3425151.1 PhzF family phenazine biosynthesis isomerase [Candidatus Latescibacterota bacterium]